MQTYKNSKDNLKKENKVERLALLDIKIYYKVTIANYIFPKGVLIKEKMAWFSTSIIRRNDCEDCE